MSAQRALKGLSQKKFAYVCGIDKSVLSKIENGQRPPTPAQLVAIAGQLGVEPRVLVEREDKNAGIADPFTFLAYWRSRLNDTLGLLPKLEDYTPVAARVENALVHQFEELAKTDINAIRSIPFEEIIRLLLPRQQWSLHQVIGQLAHVTSKIWTFDALRPQGWFTFNDNLRMDKLLILLSQWRLAITSGLWTEDSKVIKHLRTNSRRFRSKQSLSPPSADILEELMRLPVLRIWEIERADMIKSVKTIARLWELHHALRIPLLLRPVKSRVKVDHGLPDLILWDQEVNAAYPESELPRDSKAATIHARLADLAGRCVLPDAVVQRPHPPF